ncbi:hypothetical protein ACFY5D_18005 [Paeniglutamicibacter sp. NPDC012692]|uniref:hypothetical protein n=1 Tax=Paeniglutamicibacter sp. NPDC012692 TaxID=3364388 RepID=UPI0036CB78BC
MPAAMSSQRMFWVGLILGIIGLLFNIIVSPIWNWLAMNQNDFELPLGMAGAVVYVLQQGTFYGGLFLFVGSFVVRSAEAAVAGIRQVPQSHPHTEQD